MNRPFTAKAEREMEELWSLRREAIILLGHINDEFRTDPHSVQCFDLRVVNRVGEVLKRIKQIDPLMDNV